MLSQDRLILFAAIDDPQTRPLMVTSRDWSDKYRLNLEKQVLGLYLSGHPINSYKAELQKHCRSSIASVMHSISHKTVPVIFSGVVIDYSERISKKDGSKFYFMMLDDSTSQLEITLYSKNAQDFGEILEDVYCITRLYQSLKMAVPMYSRLWCLLLKAMPLLAMTVRFVSE